MQLIWIIKHGDENLLPINRLTLTCTLHNFIQMMDKIELESELVQLRGIEGEVEGELDVLRRDRDRLEEECKPLRDLEGYLEPLKSAKFSLEVENQNLHQKISVLQMEIKNGKLECEERLREFEQMKTDLVTLRNERDKLRICNMDLKSRLQEGEKLLRETSDERDSLYDRAKKAEDEYRKLKRHVTQAGIGNVLPVPQQSAAQEAQRRRILSESSADNLSLKNKVENLTEELHRSRLDILATRSRNLSFSKSQSTAGSEYGAEDAQIETNWGWNWSGMDGGTQSSPRLLSPRLNMNQQLDALRKEKDALSKTCKGLQSLLREADVQRGRTDAERESLREKIEQQAVQLQEVEQNDRQLAKMEKLLNEEVNNKRDQSTCTKLQLRVRELEGLLGAASERSASFQSYLLEYEPQMHEQNNNKTPSSKNVEKLTLHAAELERRSVDLQQELAYQQTKYNVSLNRVNELEGLLKMADKRNAKLEISLHVQATENERKVAEVCERNEQKLQNLLHETIRRESAAAPNSEFERLLNEEKARRRGPVLEDELLAAGKSIALLCNLKGKLLSILRRGQHTLLSIHGLLCHVDNGHLGGICGDNNTDGPPVERVVADKSWSFTHTMSISDSSVCSNPHIDPIRREMACYMNGLMLDSGKNPDGDAISSCSSSHLFSISASDIDMSAIGKNRTPHIHSTIVKQQPSPIRMGMNDGHHPIHVQDEEAAAEHLYVPSGGLGTLSLEDELGLQWRIMQDTVHQLVKERSELIGRLTEIHQGGISVVQAKDDALEDAQEEVSKWKNLSESNAKEAVLAVKEVDLLKHEIDILSHRLGAVDAEKQALSREVEMKKANLAQEAHDRLTSELEREKKKLHDQEEFQYAEVLKRCEVAEVQALEAKSEAEKLCVEIQISDAKLSVLNKEKSSLKEALRRAVVAADLQQQHNQSANLLNSPSRTTAKDNTEFSDGDGSIPQLIREMGQNLKRAKEEAEEAQFALKANAVRESEVLDHMQLLASGLDAERREVVKRLSESETRCEEMAEEMKFLQENIVRKETELNGAMVEAQVLRQAERELKMALDKALNNIMVLEKRLEEAHASIKDAKAEADTACVETECLRAEVALEISKRLEHANSSEKVKDMINQELEDARGCCCRLLDQMKSLREEETEARTRAAEVSYDLLVHERECLERVTSDRDSLLKELRMTEAASIRQNAVMVKLRNDLKEALRGIMAACSSSSLHPSGSTCFVSNVEAEDSSQLFLRGMDASVGDNAIFADDAESAAFVSTCATLSIKGLEGGDVLDECDNQLLNDDVLQGGLPFGLEEQSDAALMRIQTSSPIFDETGDDTGKRRSVGERGGADVTCSVSMLSNPGVSSELTSVAQQIAFASKRIKRLVGWCEVEMLRQREGFESSSQEVLVLRSQLHEMFQELEAAKDAAKEAGGSRLELQILAEQWEDLNKDREQMMNSAVDESLALQAQRDEARCDIRKLQSIVRELEAKVESQRVELDDSRRELCSARSDASKATLAAAAAKEESDSAAAYHLNESSAQQLAAAKTMEAEILSCQLVVAEGEAKKAREELRTLQMEVPAELAEVSKQRSELLNKIVMLEKMLHDAQDALSEASGRVIFFEGQEKVQRAELDSCRKQASNLQVVLAASKEAEALAAAGREDARLQVQQLLRKVSVFTTRWKALSNAIMEGNKMLLHRNSGDGINDNLDQPEEVVVAHLHQVLEKANEYHDRAAHLEDELVDVLARAEHAEFRAQTLTSEAEAMAGQEIEVQKLKERNSAIEVELVRTNERLRLALLTLGEMEDGTHVLAKRVHRQEPLLERMDGPSIPFGMKGNGSLTERAGGANSNKENKGDGDRGTTTTYKSNQLVHSLSTMYVSIPLASLLDLKQRVKAVTLSMKDYEYEPLDEGIMHHRCGSATSGADVTATALDTCAINPAQSRLQQQIEPPPQWGESDAIEVIANLSESEELLLCALMQEMSCLESTAAHQSSHLIDLKTELITLREKSESELFKYEEAVKLNSELQSQAESFETCAETLKLQLMALQAEYLDLGMAIGEKDVEIAELEAEKQTMIVALAEKSAVLERECVRARQADEALFVAESMVTLLEFDKEKLEGFVKMEKERSDQSESAFKIVKAELETRVARIEELEEAVSYGADEMLTSVMDLKEMINAKNAELDTMTESKKKSESLAAEREAEAHVAQKETKMVRSELEMVITESKENAERLAMELEEVARIAQEEVEAIRSDLEMVTESKKKAESLASEHEAEAQVAQEAVEAVRVELEMVTESKKKAESSAVELGEIARIAQEEVEAIRVELVSKQVTIVELNTDIEHLLKLLNDKKPSDLDITTKENDLQKLQAQHEITLLDVQKYRALAAALQEQHDTVLEDAREAKMQLKNREDELNELKSLVKCDTEALNMSRNELKELEGKNEQLSFLLVQNAEAKEKEMLNAKMDLDAVSNDARLYREQARALECKLEEIQSSQQQHDIVMTEEAEISKSQIRNLEERIQELLRRDHDSIVNLKDLEEMVTQSNSAFQGANKKLICAEERLKNYRCHWQDAEEKVKAGRAEVEDLKEELRSLRLSYGVKLSELTEANEGLENHVEEISNRAGADIKRLKEELGSLQSLHEALLTESAEGEEKLRSYLNNVNEKARLEVEGLKKEMRMSHLSHETELAESNEMLEKERNDLKDAQERSKAAGVEIEGLNEDLRMLRFSYEAKLAESEEQLQKEQHALKDTQERLAATIADVNGLKEEYALLQSSHMVLSAKVSESENARSKAVEQQLKSEADLVNIEEQYKECVKRCENLSGEMEKLLHLQELQQRLTELVNTTGVRRSLQDYGYYQNEDAEALFSPELSSLPPSMVDTMCVFQALCKAHIVNSKVRVHPDPDF